MDGQCTAEELRQALAALDQSPALKARWSRMVLTRDALSGTRVRKAAPDFAFDVMAAIDADGLQAESAGSKVVPLRRVAAPAPAVLAGPARARRWQPVVGLAAAASITAAVVVFGGNLLTSPVGQARPLAQAAGVSVQTAAALVQAAAGNGGAIAETRWSQIDAAAARQLNDYLMEHSNSRSESGMGGSLSYARLAVRTADYRQAEEPR
ncbi:MAG: hypothetical protein NVS9B10_19260 [Nevskia sp.]